MRRPRLRSLGLAAMLVVPVVAGVTLLPAAPASASCVGRVSVEQFMDYAELVFVGTVEKLDNRDRWATFVIDELWKGTPGSTWVEVHGGPGGRSGSSEERSYEFGVRYLVMATDPKAGGFESMYDAKSRFEDNICTGTQPYVATLARFRPTPHLALPTTSTLAEGSDRSPSRPTVLLVVGVVTLAGLGASRLWRRRRRRSVV